MQAAIKEQLEDLTLEVRSQICCVVRIVLQTMHQIFVLFCASETDAEGEKTCSTWLCFCKYKYKYQYKI